MKGEIGATRRNTYNAEEAVKLLELNKKKQDLLIDSMNEEIKRLNEQKTLYQAQFVSQKEETSAAREALKQGNDEIKQVIQAKKNLLVDWNGALKAMENRDKALQHLKAIIKERKESILRIESEISGVKKETRVEHSTSQRLHDMKEKFESETQFLGNKMEEIEAAKMKLKEQQKMLTDSIKSTQSESQRMDGEKSEAEEKMT